jgi:hypothetical protein
MARSIEIQIPYTSEGTYTLELVAEVPGGAPIRTERQIEVTRSLIQQPSPGTMIRRPNLTRITPCIGWRTGIIYFPRCVYEVEPAWFGHDGGAERADWYGYD